MHDQFIDLSSDMAGESQSFQAKHLSKIAFLKQNKLLWGQRVRGSHV